MTARLVYLTTLVLAHFCIISTAVPLGDWKPATATKHDFTGSTTACENFVSSDPFPTSSFPFGRITALSASLHDGGAGCGTCFEIKCDGGSAIGNAQCSCATTDSIIVEGVDLAGAAENFDINIETYPQIASAACGRIKVLYRRVSCDFTSGIRLTTVSPNLWYYEFKLDRVAGYGVVDKAEIKTSSGWAQCTRNGGKYYCNGGTKPYNIPISMRFTQNGAINNVIEATNLVSNAGTFATFYSAENFRVSSTPQNPTMGTPPTGTPPPTTPPPQPMSTTTPTPATIFGCHAGNPCANNLCCSMYGWCGTSDDHCLVSRGCRHNCRSSGRGASSHGHKAKVSSFIVYVVLSVIVYLLV